MTPTFFHEKFLEEGTKIGETSKQEGGNQPDLIQFLTCRSPPSPTFHARPKSLEIRIAKKINNGLAIFI